VKKLTFLVDSSNDVINYLANYESFMEDLKNTWNEVFKVLIKNKYLLLTPFHSHQEWNKQAYMM